MKRLILLLLILLLALQTGCLESQTVDECGYVLAVGFDVGDTFAYQVSFAVQRIEVESSAPSTDGFSILCAEGDSLFEAIQTVESGLPYQLSFARTTMMIFDQKLSQQAGLLSDLLNSAMDHLLIRYNANVFVAIDGAKAVLKGLTSESVKQSIDKLQDHFLNYAENTGMLPIVNYMQFYETTIDKASDSALPLIGTLDGIKRLGIGDSVGMSDYAYFGGRMLIETELQTGVAGAALFRNEQMVGMLDGQNAQLLLIATGIYQKGGLRFPLPGSEKWAFAAISPKGSPSIKVELEGEPTVRIHLRLEADMMYPEIPDGISQEEIEQHLSQWLTARMELLFETCQSLDSDVFGIGKTAIKQFASVSAWANYDWRTVYQNLKAEIHIDVALQSNENYSFME